MQWRSCFRLILLAIGLAHLVYGQTGTTTQAMPAVATQGFDLSQTTLSARSQWCLSQTNICPQICDGVTSQNTCNTTSLTYACSCANGTTPDVTAFQGSLPYFICQATFAQCISAHPNDQTAQAVCTANEKCGTRNATAEYLAYLAGGNNQAGGSSSSTSSIDSTSSSTSLSSSVASSFSLISSSISPVGTTSSTSTSAAITGAASSAAATTTTASSTSSSTLSNTPKSSGLSTGAAAGLAVGVTLAVVFIALFAFWTLRKKRKAAKAKAAEQGATADKSNSSPSTSPSEFREKPELLGTLGIQSDSNTKSQTSPWSKSEMQTNANRHEMDPTNAYGSVKRKAVTPTVGPSHQQPEMITNSNRHEMDDTGLSATLNQPWSMDGRAELDRYGYRN